MDAHIFRSDLIRRANALSDIPTTDGCNFVNVSFISIENKSYFVCMLHYIIIDSVY